MTEDEIAGLESGFVEYLCRFRPFFRSDASFAHLGTYGRGLLSDLARKSVEPIALASGTAVRTLQVFLTDTPWDHDGMLAEMQRRVAKLHLPAPGKRRTNGLGVIGLIDETSVVKKGDKTPGVQRQYCGAVGKVENCIVTVHLAVAYGPFTTLLDSDLFLPEESWDGDRKRCAEAGIPDFVTYRPKWMIAIEQIARAQSNGIHFDWLTFDEGYGAKPEFLFVLEEMGINYVAEVPKSFRCWAMAPGPSQQAPSAAKRADDIASYGKGFRARKWKKIRLERETMAPQVWEAKAARVYLQRDDRPTGRTYWLIVARNKATGEVKYFVSNGPPKTTLLTLLEVAFCRWEVEHAFRIAKSEIGFGHLEGRSWVGLLRHMILCQLTMLFVAEQTTRYREKKSRADNGADRPGLERGLPTLAAAAT